MLYSRIHMATVDVKGLRLQGLFLAILTFLSAISGKIAYIRYDVLTYG